MWYSWLLVGTRDKELYMQMSRSLRGNDQKMMRSCTGSGILSYRSSMRWNGVVSAAMRAHMSSSEFGDRSAGQDEDDGDEAVAAAPACAALLEDDAAACIAR